MSRPPADPFEVRLLAYYRLGGLLRGDEGLDDVPMAIERLTREGEEYMKRNEHTMERAMALVGARTQELMRPWWKFW